MTPQEQSALVRATLRIFGNWKVDDSQACRILGGADAVQVRAWQTGASYENSADMLDRMALILTIHTSLRVWFREPPRGYAWMHRPNMAFENLSPIELIETGEWAALLRLKAYLDACVQTE